MKTQAPRRQNGFTLVELLVVIAIIAVLAKVGFSAGVSAIQKAKKTTALATCVALETAVNNFYTEYGSMPSNEPTGGALTADTQVDTTDLALLNALLGIETIATPQNTRAIKFLSVKEGKADKNGLIYNAAGTAVTGLYDPWGGSYSVMLDGTYDEKVSPTGVWCAPSGTAPTLNGRRAAAFTKGADKLSTTAATAADDVKTW